MPPVEPPITTVKAAPVAPARGLTLPWPGILTAFAIVAVAIALIAALR